MNNTVAILLLTLVFASCGNASKNIFGKKTPHEKYAEKLDDAGLEKTPAGRQWLAASKIALEHPLEVDLPYKQTGIFGADKARALGLKFTAKRGERITFSLNKKTSSRFVMYADVFQQKGNDLSLVHASDTSAQTFGIDIDEPGTFVLRLQPELFRGGEYNLSVAVGPSLAFPVSGNNAKAGSFWGASRGGGVRTHEGVDIFAPKRTPVVAGADGLITGVKDGGIGGKVVWLKVNDRNITLYYAHLDKQLVTEGQNVTKGEKIGLVGNTGNAKSTPSHLHFGIYTMAGAIDPYPFFNQVIKTAPAVAAKNLLNYLRLTKAQKLGGDNVITPANTLLVPVAVTSKGYISETPDGRIVQVNFSVVQTSSQQVRGSETLAGKSVKESKNKRNM